MTDFRSSGIIMECSAEKRDNVLDRFRSERDFMLTKLQKLIFPAALLCCAVLRIYLKLSAIDPATGFYENNLMSASLFSWILGASCLVLLLFGWLPKDKSDAPALHMGLFARGCLVVSGIAAMVFIGSSLFDQVDSLLTFNPDVAGATVVFSLLFSVAGIFCMLVAPVITGILFIVIGLRGNRGTGRYHGALLLLPVLWQTAMLLTTFMGYTLMRSVSDQMLAIVMLILMVPFLLANGRVLGGIDAKKGARQLAMFGLPFSLVAVSLSLGVLIAGFADKSVEIGLSSFAAVFYLCMGLYAASAVFSLRPE